MAQGQRAGLITLRSLDRNELPVLLHFGCFTEAAPLSIRLGILNRHGAAAARRFTLWAHNPEVTRSKRVAGIHYTSVALQKQH